MSGDPNRPGWRQLRAGELEAWFVPADGALREIRWRGEEVVRGIYGAVRDRNWGTVPVVLGELAVREDEAGFHVAFLADARPAGVPFTWRGTITGGADGTLAYAFEGGAEGAFLRNRIGLCVLHPASCAGAAAEVEHGDGARVAGAFPALVAPHQPFRDLRALTHRTPDGAAVTVRLEGETFEMEDQRNWTDASFKTYGTPLERPFPVEVRAGDAVRQRVSVTCVSEKPRRGRAACQTVAIRHAGDRTALPDLGLQAGARRVDAADVAPLREAAPAFLRVELHPGRDGWTDNLAHGAALADVLGCGVELAVRLDGAGEHELAMLAALVPPPVLGRVARVLAVRRDVRVVAPGDVARLRGLLAAAVPGAWFGGGTDAYFAELNRGRPDPAAFDFLAFSINPQVHAFDDRSLVETLAMQGVVTHDARVLARGRPVVVSPITLRPRFNPNATGADAPPAPGALPPDADPRQAQVFGALWTLGSVKAVAEAGAAAVCYCEPVGPCGVLSGARGPVLPPPYPPPGVAYPVLEVFRRLAPFRGGAVETVQSSQPLDVEALVVERGGVRRMFLANFGPEARWSALDAALEPVRAEVVLAEDGPPRALDVREPLPARSLVEVELAGA